MLDHAANREKDHREELREQEIELENDPEWVILTVILHNDIDPQSSHARPLKGYDEKVTGVTFSDRNAVAHLRRGGLAAREAQLRVGDIVLAVEGRPLDGERVPAALNARPRRQYELKIARRADLGAGGASVLVQGVHQGWLHFLRAKDGEKLRTLDWPRKMWVVLDSSGNLSLHKSKRAKQPLHVYSLKGADAKTPVTKLRGEELYQPPVIALFLSALKFPLTLFWEVTFAPNRSHGTIDWPVLLCSIPLTV